MHTKMICLLILLVSICTCNAQANRILKNEQFQIEYSTSGIESLKKTNDAYDTDYILERNNIGDLIISFRNTGDEQYTTIKEATLAESDEDHVSYNVGFEISSFLSSAKPSASVRTRGLNALNDGGYIEDSSSRSGGFLSFRGRKGTKEWVQYDFPKEVTVSAAEVYWMDDYSVNGPYRVPKSWKLLYKQGDSFKEVNESGNYGIEIDKYNRVTFQPVKTSALRLELRLNEDISGGIHEWKVDTDEDEKLQAQGQKKSQALSKQIKATSSFKTKGNALIWTIDVKNLSDKDLEIADIGMPIRFNTNYGWDKETTYTKRVIGHFLIAGNGSFAFWMRPNTEPPYLLFTPMQNTSLEYFDRGSDTGKIFTPYIHSKSASDRMKQRGGDWRQENTAVILKPSGQEGDSVKHSFKFQWANGYESIRQLLCEEDNFDIHVVPGMVIPTGLTAQIALRTNNKIDSISPEFPNKTKIKYLGKKQTNIHIYEIAFAKLGENMLTVNYDGNKKMPLEFFVTEPLETLIKKRSAFLVNKHQYSNSGKWYEGVYSDWDMKNRILRSSEDRDGLSAWLTDACDDAGNARPAYIASKNVFFPDQKEIESVDLYIDKYLWGGMQCTEVEEFPYAIYGIPNWKVNRDSSDPGRNGKKHIWRIYDYPHIALLYYRMYQIADLYPDMKTELTKDQYLMRAYNTAVAYFTVPLKVENWSAYHTPTMNEIVINDLIKALRREGKKEEVAELCKHWNKKVEYFVNDDPYLFGSEFAFDSTGFESTGAFARYALEALENNDRTLNVTKQAVDKFIEKQLNLNIAARGWLETAYYYLGSDYRSGAGMAYTLSYMSQMGGWSIMDYALYYSKEPFKYLRLGYASNLSSWALVNSGTKESNYGYWYSGKENDGAAGGGFEPAAYARGWLGKWNKRGSWYYSAEQDVGYNAALRTATTVVADDPIFGLIAYGGVLEKTKDQFNVYPKDGLRQSLHIIKKDKKIHLMLQRDGFDPDKPVSILNSCDSFVFTVENRAKSDHTTNIELLGIDNGSYTINVNGKETGCLQISNKQLSWPLSMTQKTSSYSVKIIKSEP
jgi:hypothetical protein